MRLGVRRKRDKDDKDINYRESRDSKRYCANCGMFTPGEPKTGKPGKCDLVKGDISPAGLCDRWVKK